LVSCQISVYRDADTQHITAYESSATNSRYSMDVGVGEVGVVHYVFDMSLMANISCYHVKT